MSVTSTRNVAISFSGDITEQITQSAAPNAVSPAKTDKISLAIGFNTITPPANAGDVITGLTIIPPSGNTNIITLKGVTGDTGIALHLTDPTSIGLSAGTPVLGLTVSVAVVGVRLIWS